ncbi:glutamate carboxypeptidase [Pasteurella langaaensis DSM 22999]|uniref:Glutamate carboxypeptidase n=1 Tax=Alitibacter langaaensis DSM 22999 TaxID=1122935 RepID=A0A2U0T6G9_9PAST|nr:M20/M25/M40 family metallo-hydrolase [Pasteurella langaaensis]PVX39210.1 glutamate carboxypeptidase [Pasteurella langaaensis DSM 22999]
MNEQHLSQFISELKELTEIESPSYSIDGVNQVANWFIKKAEKQGLQYRKIPMNTDKVADCLLISNNLQAEKFDILFVAHMDTVFPVGTGQSVPFNIEGNQINALGVIDDKSGGLLAFSIIQALDLSKYNVAIYLNSHEEIGSMYAKESIREYARKAKYCFVMEAAREDGSMVASRKGLVTYDVEFFGIAAHAGNCPEKGRSALVEAANFIVEFSKYNDFERQHTFNCVMKNGGTAHNIIADYASLTIEMRYKYPESVAFFEDKLAQLLTHSFVEGVTSKKVLINSEAPMIDEVNLPTIKSVFAEAAQELNYPLKWVDAGGLSDGNVASSAGCPTIDGLGPIGGNMHAKTEYMLIDSVIPKYHLVLNAINKLLA